MSLSLRKPVIAAALSAMALMAWADSGAETVAHRDRPLFRPDLFPRGRFYRPRSRCLGINCTNGGCVHGDVGCNSVNDCGDNSDEANCAAYHTLRRCTQDGRQPFISYGHFCYLFSITQDIFDASARACHLQDSQLVSIHSEEESRFLVQTLKALALHNGFFGHAAYWIGMQEVKNGTYEWLDGTPMVYENWNSGEPNSPNETCVEMYNHGAWNDAPCQQIKGFICKALANSNASKENCEPTWLLFNGSRYILLDTDEETWYNAEEICYSRNARLAAITSENERRWITEVLLAKRRGDYSAWIYGSLTTNDSAPEDSEGYAGDLMSIHHCPSIVKDRKLRQYGTVKTDSCFRRKGLICKDEGAGSVKARITACVFPFIYDGKTVSHCIDDVNGSSWCSRTANFDSDRQSQPCDVYGCPPGWWSLGADCYYIPHHRSSWAEGSASCQYADGSLADVTRPSALNFLLNKLVSLNITAAWVGDQSKRTSNATVMTTETAGQLVAMNSSQGIDEKDRLLQGGDCRAIFTTSHPMLLQVVNCSEQWNFICIKQTSLLSGTAIPAAVGRTTEYPASTQERYSSGVVYTMIGVGSAVIILLLLSWPVYFAVRRLRNRDSSEGPAWCFLVEKEIRNSLAYNRLQE